MANENTDPRLLGQSNFYSSFCRLLLLFFLIQTIHLILHCLNCWIESETTRRTGCLDLSTSEKWEKERPRPLECSVQRQMCVYMYLFRSRTDSTRSLSFSLKIVFFPLSFGATSSIRHVKCQQVIIEFVSPTQSSVLHNFSSLHVWRSEEFGDAQPTLPPR